MTSARTIKNSKLQTDIVIIGAGAAGFSAAVATVESGVKKYRIIERDVFREGMVSFLKAYSRPEVIFRNDRESMPLLIVSSKWQGSFRTGKLTRALSGH